METIHWAKIILPFCFIGGKMKMLLFSPKPFPTINDAILIR